MPKNKQTWKKSYQKLTESSWSGNLFIDSVLNQGREEDQHGKLTIPQTVSGKTLGNILRRLPYWQQLVAEYKARGEWLRPYSFRDTFSVQAHGYGIEDTMISAAMGHSVEVHHRSYRTSEWRSVRKAFAEAS